MAVATIEQQIEEARLAANIYRLKGYNPIPSHMDEERFKQPMVYYRDYWEKALPERIFERFPTTNLQIMTGRFWKLLVIDLDGKGGKEWFYDHKKPVPRTWVSHSGGGGEHWWFTLTPRQCEKPIPKGFLWKGEGKHNAVERFGDYSIIMAPPSIRPGGCRKYRWRSRRESYLLGGMGKPANCPDWILGLPLIEKPKPIVVPIVPRKPSGVRPTGSYRWEDVLDAIHDKVAVAQEYGVRIADNRRYGWISCHSIYREDRHPSACFCCETGAYKEPGIGVFLKFFELIASISGHAKWEDACNELGDRFCPREQSA